MYQEKWYRTRFKWNQNKYAPDSGLQKWRADWTYGGRVQTALSFYAESEYRSDKKSDTAKSKIEAFLAGNIDEKAENMVYY